MHTSENIYSIPNYIILHLEFEIRTEICRQINGDRILMVCVCTNKYLIYDVSKWFSEFDLEIIETKIINKFGFVLNKDIIIAEM